MIKPAFIFVFTLLTMSISAQQAEYQKEIKDAFASYKEAFSNGNQAQKTLYYCFEEASSVGDTKEYLSNAEILANRSKRHMNDVLTEVEEARVQATKLNCNELLKKLDSAEQALSKGVLAMGTSEDHLSIASKKKGIEDMVEDMKTAMTELQNGMKSLNSAIENLNGSMKVLKSCK